MLRPIPPTDCTLAREAASARADGELAELDAGRLEAHLLTCPECVEFTRGIGALALRMRGADLEQPDLPVFVATRRRPTLRLNTAVAAVVLALAAASSFAVGHVVGSHGGRPAATVATLGAVATHRGETLGMLRNRPGRMVTNRVVPV